MSQSHKTIISPNFEKMWIQQDRRKFRIHTGKLSNNKDQVFRTAFIVINESKIKTKWHPLFSLYIKFPWDMKSTRKLQQRRKKKEKQLRLTFIKAQYFSWSNDFKQVVHVKLPLTHAVTLASYLFFLCSYV